jgi:hypothetical protein
MSILTEKRRYSHFTTQNFPQGIYVRPSIDIIFFGTTNHISSYDEITSPCDYCRTCRLQRADLTTDLVCPACSGAGFERRLGRYGRTNQIQNFDLYDWATVFMVDHYYYFRHNDNIEMNNLQAFTRAFPNLKRVLLSFEGENSLVIPDPDRDPWYKDADDDRVYFTSFLEETPQYKGRVLPDVVIDGKIRPGTHTSYLMEMIHNMELEELKKLSATDRESPIHKSGQSFHKTFLLIIHEKARELKSKARRGVRRIVSRSSDLLQLRRRLR